MWILWSIDGNYLHLIFMQESEQINYFCPFTGIVCITAAQSRSLDENIDVLVKILAVIFINE